MGFEPVLFFRPPLRLAWIERLSSYRSVSFFRWFSHFVSTTVVEGEAVALIRWVGRAIGLDVHRDFCVVAICEDGKVRSGGRVPSTPEGLGLLAQSLLPSDRVALEVTGSCWEVARLLEAHVQRVVVVSPDDTGISSARAKTDTRLSYLGELVVEGGA
jgi:hypothetical protein